MSRIANKITSAFLTCLLALGCAGVAATALAATSPQQAHAAQEGGWEKSRGKWWYAYQEGGYATGWADIDNSWYLFDNAGWMQTGWHRVGGTWYYLHGSGAMAEGWAKVGNAWYYLYPGSGAMATGWVNDNGTWYHMNGSGAMQTGWQRIGGTWYYLWGSGAMAEGWVHSGGAWYYLYPGSGAMATGWIEVDGLWYYLNGSGAMQANRWIGDYYVGGSGAMATSTWIDGYYVDSTGRWNDAAANGNAITYDPIVGEWHIKALTTSGGSGWVYYSLPHSNSCLKVYNDGTYYLKLDGDVKTGTWTYDAEQSDSSIFRYSFFAPSGQLLWVTTLDRQDDDLRMLLANGQGTHALMLYRA